MAGISATRLLDGKDSEVSPTVEASASRVVTGDVETSISVKDSVLLRHGFTRRVNSWDWRSLAIVPC